MSFENIIGHREVVENLKNRLRQQRFHHAIMFYGPAGIGKRTLALEFIKAINCKDSSDANPCDNCNNCKWTTEYTHPDLFIITNGMRAEYLQLNRGSSAKGRNAASEDSDGLERASKREISIDRIRYLEEVIYTRPVEGKYKVIFIIDAESLNKSSANAFLKTLEEPPPQTLIVMTSSYLGMVPVTIRSRIEKIRLNPLSDVEMKRLLDERLNYSSKYMDVIIRLLNGGIDRDIISIDDESIGEYLDIIRQFVLSDRISFDDIVDIAGVLTNSPNREERELRIGFFFDLLRALMLDILLDRNRGVWKEMFEVKRRITFDMIEDLNRIAVFMKVSQGFYCNSAIGIKSELLRYTRLWNMLSA